jgi:hypothetical protein
VSFWPSPPGLPGWLVACISVILAAITLWTMTRTRAGGSPIASPRLTLHVTGMT